MVMNAICTAALSYAGRGWKVFPALIKDGKKKSYKAAKYSNGENWGATADPKEIRDDFAKWRAEMVGIPTGPEQGFFVVEADTPKGHDVDGIGTLRKLEAQHGKLPKTLMAESPTGSLHYYFKWPPKGTISNTTSTVAPGIDVRGSGGMVLAPPSIRSGVGVYRWLNQHAIADAPSWLIKLTVKADIPHVSNSESTAELELLFAAMGAIPNENVGWETWNKVGMAIYRSSDGKGFAVFDQWSRKSVKYNAHKTREKWLEYSKYPPDRIGVKSIVYWANRLSPGWAEKYGEVKEFVTFQNRKRDPETRRRQIAWMKEHVWK
jgi:hypothetical protein